MKKKLVIISSWEHDKHTFKQKYGILYKKIFSFKIINVEKIIFPKLKITKKSRSLIYYANNLSNLRVLIKKIKPDFFLLHMDSRTKMYVKIYKMLKSESSALSIIDKSEIIPDDFVKITFLNKLKMLNSLTFFNNYLKTFYKNLKINNNKKINISYDISYLSGSYCDSLVEIKNSKKKINVHSYDFQKFLDLKNKNYKKNKNISIFLDEQLFTHRDIKYEYMDNLIEKETYYKEMNKFFSFVEKTYSQKIIISLHPRCKVNQIKKMSKIYQGRECSIGDSHKLAAKAKYIFLHPSTSSLNIPIIFKKSFYFIVTNEFIKNTNWKRRFLIRNQLFPNRWINISKSTSKIRLKKNYDKRRYGEYLTNFITKHKHNKSRDQVILESLL